MRSDAPTAQRLNASSSILTTPSPLHADEEAASFHSNRGVSTLTFTYPTPRTRNPQPATLNRKHRTSNARAQVYWVEITRDVRARWGVIPSYTLPTPHHDPGTWNPEPSIFFFVINLQPLKK